MEKMKKTIALLITALIALVLVTSALPLSVGICATTDGDQQGGGAEVLMQLCNIIILPFKNVTPPIQNSQPKNSTQKLEAFVRS